MSTVEIECRDATCPDCNYTIHDLIESYLPKGEVVPEGWHHGHRPPVYTPVMTYQAVCDRCGWHVTDYGGWSSIGDTPGQMFECLPDWEHIGGRDLCPGCWQYNDDTGDIEEVPK